MLLLYLKESVKTQSMQKSLIFAACETLKTFGFGAQIVDLQASFRGSGNRRFPSMSKSKILTVFYACKIFDFAVTKLCFVNMEKLKFFPATKRSFVSTKNSLNF